MQSFTCLLLVAVVARGQEPSGSTAEDASNTKPATDVERAEETVLRARAEAEHYRIVRDDDPQAKVELREKPILKWSNPSEGALFGSVVLWTVDGRPEAVASIYRWYTAKREFHAEFKSLSTHPLSTTRGKEPAWATGESDVKFHVLAHGSPPADREGRRAQQMRDIARRFAADLVHPSKGRNVLRLLPQPVYRYEKLPRELLDGALFAFVQGTDPEVFLLIEAEKTDGGARWRYAASRMNMFELHLSLDDKEVWNAPEMTWNDVADRRGPYTIIVLDY
jgi:hypothetical protein